MTKDTWNSLSFFEQLSNIEGDVERLIRAHEKYENKASEKDYGYFYLDRIRQMIKMTFFDPKNIPRAYRAIFQSRYPYQNSKPCLSKNKSYNNNGTLFLV